jgi:hypothetical protein
VAPASSSGPPTGLREDPASLGFETARPVSKKEYGDAKVSNVSCSLKALDIREHYLTSWPTKDTKPVSRISEYVYDDILRCELLDSIIQKGGFVGVRSTKPEKRKKTCPDTQLKKRVKTRQNEADSVDKRRAPTGLRRHPEAHPHVSPEFKPFPPVPRASVVNIDGLDDDDDDELVYTTRTNPAFDSNDFSWSDSDPGDAFMNKPAHDAQPQSRRCVPPVREPPSAAGPNSNILAGIEALEDIFGVKPHEGREPSRKPRLLADEVINLTGDWLSE